MPDIKENLSFKDLTTLKIGGPIRYFVSASSNNELVLAVKFANQNSLPFLVIGGGSNLLVSDQGFLGLVIKNEVEGSTKHRNFLTVKGGTPLKDFVSYSIAQGLGEIEKLAGIPGTIAGAVYGNAGAYGQTISDCIRGVICFDGREIVRLDKEECEFTYRNSGFKRNMLTILEVIFKLPYQDTRTLEKEAIRTLEKRQAKYKPSILCPGSFFKNLFLENLPPQVRKTIPKDRDYFGKVPAWYFLDEVGARGDKLGEIMIADFHGNLFINLGTGTAEDFYNLAKKYYLKVKEKFGIELEPEVQLINLSPFNK